MVNDREGQVVSIQCSLIILMMLDKIEKRVYVQTGTYIPAKQSKGLQKPFFQCHVEREIMALFLLGSATFSSGIWLFRCRGHFYAILLLQQRSPPLSVSRSVDT